MSSPGNLQETFLNTIRKNKTAVTVFLISGVKLQGYVSWFDNFCILLRRHNSSQLVYKHAVSTIMPMELVTLPTIDADSDQQMDDSEHTETS